MSVELRHLRYFLAVAEELHFGRAAQRVGIAQPALSQQIRRLEEEVGAELFHRTKRTVSLSAAGGELAHHARRALESTANGVEAARRAARGETGHLTVGFIESAAATLVPRAVRRFRAGLPDVGLALREMGVAAQLEQLRSGALDVGVLRPPIEAPELELRRVIEEPLVVAVPEVDALSGRRRIAPRALAGRPLVLLSRDVVPGLYDQILGVMHDHGGAAIAHEATSIQAVLGLVAAELGVSLLPASVRSLDRAGVRFVPLVPSPTTAMVVARRRDDRSPIVMAFIEAAQAAASEPPTSLSLSESSRRRARRSPG